jgi:ComF family protein
MALNITESDKTRFYDFLAFKNPGNVCLSYVPLHKKKEKTRGFNQSKLMAQEIGKITNLKTENLLEKTKETKSQTELDIKERMENVKDSFTLRLDSDFSERFTLKGSDTLRKNQNPRFANILLIDDIWTTGATMKECCKVLKKGGAKRVWGFVLARTV